MKPVAYVLSPIIVAAALAGCTPQASLWSEADARKEITVHKVEVVHNVAFAPSSSEISAPEFRRLDEFLSRQHIGYGDTVEIHTPGADARLDSRRAAAVSSYLLRAGVAADRGSNGPASDVRITVSRSVAVPPACGDWRKPSNDGDPGNTPSSNFGCANMRNLGMMVADPSELVAGHPAGPGQGESLAAGVKRFRAGEIKPLTPFTESAGNGSSSSGGGQ
ncbi:MAG TPA: CpaD family pilus assembly lipoprotein [Alphaproteobacteria bacterium]|jgi:pilus assembly protein CpaD|nr:CpaD family pilus assembly lipoprotein [Alphaproteobacteria bacterium]